MDELSVCMTHGIIVNMLYMQNVVSGRPTGTVSDSNAFLFNVVHFYIKQSFSQKIICFLLTLDVYNKGTIGHSFRRTLDLDH